MRKIILPETGIEVPVLGFGCSALTSTSRRNALHVLSSAFDCGVRHFDVARYYGYGEAEGILGAFAKKRRAQITITTKFGIVPPQRTMLFRAAVHVGRRLLRFVPAARKMAQQQVNELTRSGAFSLQEAKSSLETSLRQLGTDYIDFYLLHDYSLEGSSPEELVCFLEAAVRAGKIRRFGIGTTIENVLRVLEVEPRLCGTIQFQNSVLTRNVDKMPCHPSDRLIITHGSLGGSYNALLSFLKTHDETARNWSQRLSMDCCREETLSALMLNYAVEANPNGMVLFSSRSPVRVRRNITDVLERNLAIAQITLFSELVKQALPVLSTASAARI